MEHTATYSPEDNKLRIYPGNRLDDELGERYAEFKAAGYKWAAKQECFVCPRWTPQAEDWALELAGEIGDEDYSPEERSADRAERFSGYREKRRGEAHGHADTYDAGPSIHAHHDIRRAERQARRHDRERGRALNQWSKAEYWQQRTEGVISHALYRSSAPVRRSRLLRLESELRRFGCMSERWKLHYELRIGYEKAMLANEGGMAADVEMEAGGWLGQYQIQRVYKSPATGRVVSVTLIQSPGILKRLNVERFGESIYRAPTDEERETFKTEQAAQKAARKATAPKAPPLINPTDADAERLQAIWNARAEASHNRNKCGEFKPSEVLRLTQAEYSARSKGAYSPCETVEISEQLKIRRRSTMSRDVAGRVTVFKIRKTHAAGNSWRGVDRVIVLTDKPQKPLPWEQVEEIADEQPSAEKLLPRMKELTAAVSLSWLPADGTPESKIIDDAVYVGWCFVSSMTQFGWTEEGAAVFREWIASQSKTPATQAQLFEVA